jgi:MinD superfamily P-loop ATPase
MCAPERRPESSVNRSFPAHQWANRAEFAIVMVITPLPASIEDFNLLIEIFNKLSIDTTTTIEN